MTILKMIKTIILLFTLVLLPSMAMTKVSSHVTKNREGEPYTMNQLTLKKANAIIEAAFAESKKLHLKPMSVAILDAGGNLVAFQREDKAGILRFDIAYAKAYGALGMGIGSRGLALKAKEIPALINGAMSASNGRLIPAPGGVLIMDRNNNIIGAAGASGDTSDNDEHSLIVGIQSVGFNPKVD